MKGLPRNKAKSISEQISVIKSKYPQFESKFFSYNGLIVSGVLQPTARSEKYQFKLKYYLDCSPKIKIISPALQKNSKNEDIPHIYPGENLCLYQPKYREFKNTDLLAETIIPWTSLWLYYYELWLVTDEWHGGGEHP